MNANGNLLIKRIGNKIPIMIRVIIIIAIIIVLLGFFSTFRIPNNINVEETEVNRFYKFISVFLTTYWWIFLVWLLGNNAYTRIFSLLIIIGKLFMLGITIGITRKIIFIVLLKYLLIELLVLFPMLLFLLIFYVNMIFQNSKRRNNKENEKKKLIFILIIMIAFCFLYSVLNVL